MGEQTVIVTRKGQTTIPIAIRQLLGLRQGDRVVFVLEDGHVCIKRSGSVVARTAGILKSARPPLTAEELRDAGEQAIAEDAAERAGE